MRLCLQLGAIAGALAPALVLPAHASAASYRIMGVAPYTQAVEAEIGGDGFPLRVGAQVFYLWNGNSSSPWAPYSPVGGRQHWNAWATYQRAVDAETRWGVMAGIHQSRFEKVVIEQETGGLIGVVYEREWGDVCLRVRPTILVIPLDWAYLPWYGILAKSAVLSGIPWVEAAYRVMPNVELSLRASLTPLALSLNF